MELLPLGLEEANGGDRVGWGAPRQNFRHRTRGGKDTLEQESRGEAGAERDLDLMGEEGGAQWGRGGAGESSPAQPTRPVNSPVLHLLSLAGAAWGPEQGGRVTDRADPGEAEVQPPGRGVVGGLAVPTAA